MSRKGQISLPREDFQIIIACIKRVMSRKGQISLPRSKVIGKVMWLVVLSVSEEN